MAIFTMLEDVIRWWCGSFAYGDDYTIQDHHGDMAFMMLATS